MDDSYLFITDDGSHSIYSEKFGVSYHSKYGAIEETQHVFINAALKFKAVIQQYISILEIGFGTGLNAFATFSEAKKSDLIIKYTAVEAYPISIQQAEQLNNSDLIESKENADLFLKLHQQPWNIPFQLNDQFTIEKVLKKFQEIEYKNQFDIIYFDAFAPNAQPELWSDEMLAKMFEALLPEGILVTYCAKGEVKRSLKRVGFTIESLPGPTGKREMTRAVKIVKPKSID